MDINLAKPLLDLMILTLSIVYLRLSWIDFCRTGNCSAATVRALQSIQKVANLFLSGLGVIASALNFLA